MFRAKSEQYTFVKENVETVKSEASLARTAGLLGDSFATGSVSGAWVGRYASARVSLGCVLDGFIRLSEEYAETAKYAAKIIDDNLVPARDAVLLELGADAGVAGGVAFDESADQPSRFLEVDVAADGMQCSVDLASLSAFGLPGADAVTTPLSALSSALLEQSCAFSAAASAFGKYRSVVSDFETTYGEAFSNLAQEVLGEQQCSDVSNAIQVLGGAALMTGTAGETGLWAVLKNGGGSRTFFDSFKDGKFLESLKDNVTSTFDADKWENAYGRTRGIETDKFDELSDTLGKVAKASDKASDWSQWAKRLGGAADVLGYWGDVCDIAEVGDDVIKKAVEGDFLGAAGEACYGAVKILGGKLVTTAASFAVGGPVGVVVGIGAGVLWDWGCEAFHDGKPEEHLNALVEGGKEFVDGIGDFFSDVGDFFGG